MKDSMNQDIYPLTIVADRYGGSYAGAAFTAWNKGPDEVPDEINGCDRDCGYFWANANRAEIGFGDTPDESYEDLCAKFGVKARKRKIKYWIYELEMSEETSKAINRVLIACEMTLDEFFAAAVQSAIDDPEGTRVACKEYEEHPESFPDINIVRFYPVYREETEAQARHRKLAEESQLLQLPLQEELSNENDISIVSVDNDENVKY